MNWRDKVKNWLSRSDGKVAVPADTGDDAVDPFDPFPDGVRVPLNDVFDLHTVKPSEMKQAVKAYLADARAAGFRSVRVIHGKGTGVQREMVHTILARTPFVDRFTEAPPEAGGWGATIAFFKPASRS